MKKINFFDGAESSTTPVIGNISATHIAAYANDAAYEAANGVGIAGSIYYNTTLNVKRYYDADAVAWKSDLEAQLDATVIADGTISNTEFQHLNGVSSNIQTQLTTNATAISDHLADTVDAHDASAISNIPSGNLAATDQQSVNNELQSDIDSRIPSSEKGANSGVATLDSGGKVPAAQLPSTVMSYLGVWNATTNTPTLIDGTGDTGDVYRVSVAGTQDLGSGNITFGVGDWVIYNGTIWEKSSNSDAVVSVNGYTGVVSLVKADIGLSNVDNTSDATKNSASATLTNKTIDGDDNTVQDLPLTSLKTNVTDASKFLVRDGSGIVISNTKTVPSGDVLGTTDTQVITAKDIDGGTASNTSRITIPKASKTTLDGLTRKQGTIVYASDQNKLYSDNGSILSQIGSGSGQGGINYITNYGLEDDATGYSTFADAAQSTPVDGTAGSPTVTATRNTTTPLRGTADLNFVKDAANRQGEGFSYDFTIDSADKGRVLEIGFDYEILSGTYTTGDMTVWIYDVTNAVLLPQPSGNSIANITVVGQHGQCTFQSAINSTSYRLIFHVSTTSASAYTLAFDNISVGPQLKTTGAMISDWVSYTPAGSWTSNSTYTGKWRRIGDSVELQIYVTLSGAPTAVELAVDLPSGMTIDTSKLNNIGSNALIPGNAFMFDTSATTWYRGQMKYSSTTRVSGTVLDAGATYVQYNQLDQTRPFTFASGDSVMLQTMVPIVGWSSGVVSSSSTDNRIVVLSATGDAASASGGNPVIFPTTTYDTHAGYNASTGRYTAPVNGFYRISGFITSANAGIRLSVYVNAVDTIDVGATDSSGECSYSGLYRLNAGDIIDLRPGGTLDVGSRSTLNVERVSGPQQVAASESINMRASGATTAVSSGATTTLINPTESYDSHNAYNTSTGEFTTPVSGKYSVKAAANGSWGAAAANRISIKLFKNGSEFSNMGTIFTTTASGGATVSGSDDVQCNAGDVLTIRFLNSLTQTWTADGGLGNFVAISRIGN